MRAIRTEPSVAFTRGCPWPRRDDVDGCEFAGVYALARFEAAPPAAVNVLDERVIYIGETCDNTITGRLYQFNRSAFMGKAGHSGGWSYRARYGDAGEHLYVAASSVSTLDEPYRSVYIRHLERKLLWDYVLRWGRRPPCNSK